MNRTAALATLHCLTGCAIGEVLGLVIGTALSWSNAATIALAVALAFVFGYGLTMLPLVRGGLEVRAALPLAFAADSFSITVMEVVDNGVMLAIPGAMDAPLSNPLFWGALAFALLVAYFVAYPVNRYLIARGHGHAVVHAHHAQELPIGHGPTAAATLSPRRMVAIGAAAMAATIAVAAGGALVVESGGHSEGRDLSGLAVETDGYRLVVRKPLLVTGRRTRFAFVVQDDTGPVREFDEEGGVRMHLIVVRRDLTGYQHLHPTLQPDGSWATELVLPAAGVYRAYADFERDGERTALAYDVFAAGPFEPAPLPAASARASVGGYHVELEAHGSAGDEMTLAYTITRGGEPVDVESYLGAAGHLVALRQGDLAYLHVHPLEEELGRVRFEAAFATPGNYRLFLQFKDEGRVHTVPLTIAVAAGD